MTLSEYENLSIGDEIIIIDGEKRIRATAADKLRNGTNITILAKTGKVYRYYSGHVIRTKKKARQG